MPVITLRVDDATKADLEELAGRQGTSISESIRLAVAGYVGRDLQQVPGEDGQAPESLAATDRLGLALQHRALALGASDPDDQAHYEKCVTILERGFTGEYHLLFAGIDPELPVSDCRFVWDVLDLFRVLEFSLARLTEAERAGFGPYDAEFLGFDGNDESALLAYARFLVLDEERWQELAPRFGPEHDRGNSHGPTVRRYREMVGTWRQIQSRKRRLLPDDYLLNAGEIQDIVDAGRLGQRPPGAPGRLKTSRDW